MLGRKKKQPQLQLDLNNDEVWLLGIKDGQELKGREGKWISMSVHQAVELAQAINQRTLSLSTYARKR